MTAFDTLLDALEDRIVAVLCEGRGTNGSLGTDAQSRAITAAVLRRPATDVSVRDTAVPAEEFDRFVSIEWLGVGDTQEVSNEYDTPQLITLRCNVLVGYAAATSLSGFAHIHGSETAANAVAHWRRRALGDAQRIKHALCFLALAGGTLSDGVEWVGAVRDGDSVIEDLGEGRALCATPLKITAQYTLT